MFACAVLAVSVLRKKCSKKQKSNNKVININSDFLGGNQDLETLEIPFNPEKDTLELSHKMEHENKSLVKHKSVDQTVKLDAFKNNVHHADARTDLNASRNKEPSHTIGQNNKVNINLMKNKAKVNSEIGDTDNSFNLIYNNLPLHQKF